eukprot:TRINITY_DN28388_c0_g2_i1.p1 TRINITY_DN28388_c0_g2~~TRINITY_DN28388_c0_g2_i1.p1  ORF type:complete len:465 (+),score=103.38 TRINITY_DN28388_c0_g2_i1:258-1652(+)
MLSAMFNRFLALIVVLLSHSALCHKMSPKCEALYKEGREAFLAEILPKRGIDASAAPAIRQYIQKLKDQGCVLPQKNMICTVNEWFFDFYFTNELKYGEKKRLNVLLRSLGQFMDVCVAGAEPENPPPFPIIVKEKFDCKAKMQNIVKVFNPKNPINFAEAKRVFQALRSGNNCVNSDWESCLMNEDAIAATLGEKAAAFQNSPDQVAKAQVWRWYETRIRHHINFCTVNEVERLECQDNHTRVNDLYAKPEQVAVAFKDFKKRAEMTKPFLQECNYNILNDDICRDYKELLLPIVEMTEKFSEPSKNKDYAAFQAAYKALGEGMTRFVASCFKWGDFKVDVSAITAAGNQACEAKVNDYKNVLSGLIKPRGPVVFSELFNAYNLVISLGKNLFQKNTKTKTFSSILEGVIGKANKVSKDPKRLYNITQLFIQISTAFFVDSYDPKFQCPSTKPISFPKNLVLA